MVYRTPSIACKSRRGCPKRKVTDDIHSYKVQRGSLGVWTAHVWQAEHVDELGARTFCGRSSWVGEVREPLELNTGYLSA